MREQLGFAAQQQQSQVVHGYLGLEVLISQASMINLALLLWAKGRYEEAEPPLRQALEICRAQLGEQHPNAHGRGQLGRVAPGTGALRAGRGARLSHSAPVPTAAQASC